MFFRRRRKVRRRGDKAASVEIIPAGRRPPRLRFAAEPVVVMAGTTAAGTSTALKQGVILIRATLQGHVINISTFSTLVPSVVRVLIVLMGAAAGVFKSPWTLSIFGVFALAAATLRLRFGVWADSSSSLIVDDGSIRLRAPQ